MNSRASGDIISRTSVPARNPDFCNIILLQTSNIPAFFYTKDTFIFLDDLISYRIDDVNLQAYRNLDVQFCPFTFIFHGCQFRN